MSEDVQVAVSHPRHVATTKQPSGSYDRMILDASSSDSIPIHLLTTEAMGCTAWPPATTAADQAWLGRDRP